MVRRTKLGCLEDALENLKTMNALYGLRMIEYPRGKRRLFFSLLHLLFITSYCCYMFHKIPEEQIDSDEEDSKFSKIFYNITMFMDVTIILCSTFIGVYRTTLYDECIKKLSCVDKTLEKLGSPTDYKGIKGRTTYVLIGWGVFIILLFIASVYWLQFGKSIWEAVWIAFVYTRCLDVSGMVDITFTLTVRGLADRFDRINRLLRDECIHIRQSRADRISDIAPNEFPLRNSVRDPYTVTENSSSPVLLRKKCLIHTTRLLHFELRRATKMVSTIFGMQMAFEVATCVLVMTGVMYSLYFILVESTTKYSGMVFEIVMRHFYAIVYAAKILILNLNCEKATSKANKTVDLCFEMAFLIDDPDTKQEIEQFGLEARRVKFAFTAFGAFPLDCRILRSIFGTVITYLLILVQMG